MAGPSEVVTYAKAAGVEVIEVKPGQDYTLAGVSFHTVSAYYLEGTDHPRASGWVGYVLRFGDVTYYVTSDTQPLPEMAEVKADVLFAPVFGCGTNIDQALVVVKTCKAKVVVPVHSSGRDDVVTAFLAQLPQGVQGAYYKDGTLIIEHRSTAK